MSSPRRIVRATAAFFDDLDQQLRPERGPSGEPSVNDFRLTSSFGSSTDSRRDSTISLRVDGRSDYRILIAEGLLVPRFAVVGQLTRDGSIELLQVDIDRDADW
ncbi:MAG: hypothetical protein ACLFRV_09920 [Acidimicrobiales bacterium]